MIAADIGPSRSLERSILLTFFVPLSRSTLSLDALPSIASSSASVVVFATRLCSASTTSALAFGTSILSRVSVDGMERIHSTTFPTSVPPSPSAILERSTALPWSCSTTLVDSSREPGASAGEALGVEADAVAGCTPALGPVR